MKNEINALIMEAMKNHDTVRTEASHDSHSLGVRPQETSRQPRGLRSDERHG